MQGLQAFTSVPETWPSASLLINISSLLISIYFCIKLPSFSMFSQHCAQHTSMRFHCPEPFLGIQYKNSHQIFSIWVLNALIHSFHRSGFLLTMCASFEWSWTALGWSLPLLKFKHRDESRSMCASLLSRLGFPHPVWMHHVYVNTAKLI